LSAAHHDWLHDVQERGVRELKAFAQGLVQDESAVWHGLSLEWSNGQTEGHINKLKTLKRQMYGRANLDLLRNRLLKAI
jgi:transposase